MRWICYVPKSVVSVFRSGLMGGLLSNYAKFIALAMFFVVAIVGCNGCTAITAKPDTKVIKLHKQLEGKVDVGSDFILAVKDGKVYGWGTNSPNLPTPKSNSPASYDKPVIIPIPAYVVSVSAAWWHSVALDKQGRVWIWGSNKFGGLGVKHNKKLIWKVPHIMKNLPSIKAISAGGGHTLMLAEDGGVWAFGGNQGGESGKDKYENVVSLHKVRSLPSADFIYAAPFKSLAVTARGEVYVWGARSFLIPKNSSQHIPQKMDRNVCSFFDLDSHDSTVFLCDDGSMQVIGSNVLGELGLGDKKNRTKLTLNPYLKGVLEVRGADSPRISLLQDGRVYGWGHNAYGVPEFTNSFMKLRPVKVDVGRRIVDIASTHFNAFLISEKGQILHWMPNENWLIDGLYYFFGSYHFDSLKNADGTDFYLLK